MNKENAIGIFDSGMGGISVLKQAVVNMPYENFIYFGDSANAPYGTKSIEEIKPLIFNVADFLVNKGVKAIIVACNTATSIAVKDLRERYSIPVVGMEPAIKLALNNKTNKDILVMATELTLKEKKFNDLMSIYKGDNHIYKVPCPNLVSIIERDLLEDNHLVEKELKSYFDKIPKDFKTLESIVLGCTHFIFFKNYIKNLTDNKVTVLDGNEGTVNNLYRILKNNDLLREETTKGFVEFYNSGDFKKIELSKKLFHNDYKI